MLPNSGAVLPLLGAILTGMGAVLTRRAVGSACPVAAHASLVTAHHYAAHGAMTGLHAAGAQYTVT
jgi:hypothetical protein